APPIRDTAQLEERMLGLSRVALFVGSLLLLAGCGTTTETGDLQVTITGVPAGASAAVVVTGPGGFNRVVTQSGPVSGLRVGAYTLTPAEVTSPNSGYDGVERFVAAAETVAVTANVSTPVTLSYAYAGLSIDDPAGDASGNANNYPIFAALNLPTEVGSTDVTFTVTLADAGDDFTHLVVVIDLDIDQDVNTGEPAFGGGGPCPEANEIGSEFEIFAEPGFIVLIDIATDTDIDVPL